MDCGEWWIAYFNPISKYEIINQQFEYTQIRPKKRNSCKKKMFCFQFKTKKKKEQQQQSFCNNNNKCDHICNQVSMTSKICREPQFCAFFLPHKSNKTHDFAMQWVKRHIKTFSFSFLMQIMIHIVKRNLIIEMKMLFNFFFFSFCLPKCN